MTHVYHEAARYVSVMPINKGKIGKMYSGLHKKKDTIEILIPT